MEEQKNNKTEWLHVRVSKDEYEHIQKGFAKTTCRKLSDYLRKILLGKPLVGTYRNKSLDDFMAEAIQLRTELNAIGNNLNQAVRKLHTLDESTQLQAWVNGFEQERDRLKGSIGKIEDCIGKIADSWLQ